jgi:predicted ATP-dependent protease
MVAPLAPEALRAHCPPESLPFEDTKSLEPSTTVLGQERATEALDFGLRLRRKGYNVFAIGSVGVGRHTIVESYLRRRAASEPAPDDLAYVHGFADPRRPELLRLPAGRGRRLREDLEHAVEDALAAIATALATDEHQAKRRAIEGEIGKRHDEAMEALEKLARERSIKLESTPTGFTLTTMKDGEALSDEAAAALPPDEKKAMDEALDLVGSKLEELMDRAPRFQRERRERLRELERQLASRIMGPIFDDLGAKHADVAVVGALIEAIREDMVRRLGTLIPEEARSGDADVELSPALAPEDEPPAVSRYRLNVVVDNAELEGAPVIFEDHPTEERLFGRIDVRVRPSGPSSDFTMIRAGSLLRANGGYLVLDAHRLVADPEVWERLKRALRAGESRFEGPSDGLGLAGTVGLEPEPAPVDLKVILVGDRWIYYLLSESDPELEEHFKVMADFDDDVARGGENLVAFGRLVGSIAEDKGLPPFDRGAVARIIDEASRWADDAGRLSLNVRRIADLLVEAAHFAELDGAARARAADVEAALAARIRRHDRIRGITLRFITEGTHRIETEGRRVGQINGLSVEGYGTEELGMPIRITAQVRAGRGTVVDIEREVDLSGPLHSKGVLILGGFLGGRYATDRPLSLHATLVMEQSYGGVDGDSASLAEICVLLSSLAEVPLRQDVAVTGSVDQLGQVQAVGGVNAKVEGFFDVCRARGALDGQGVIIPASSARHLMLRADVVEAARAGRFHVWPVTNVDDAIALLTGVVPGDRNAYGHFAEGTVNGRVEARLRLLAATELSHDS